MIQPNSSALASLNLPFWVKVTGNDGTKFHSYVEVNPTANGSFIVLDGGRQGSITVNPLYEANGAIIPTGQIVAAKRGYFDAALDWVYVAIAVDVAAIQQPAPPVLYPEDIEENYYQLQNQTTTSGPMPVTSSSPSIGTSQNDYPVSSTILNVTATAPNLSFTGFVAFLGFFWLKNVGTNPYSLKNQDAGSSAANQIKTPNGTDYTVYPGEVYGMLYDNADNVWELYSVPSPGTSSQSYQRTINYRGKDTTNTTVIKLNPFVDLNVTKQARLILGPWDVGVYPLLVAGLLWKNNLGWLLESPDGANVQKAIEVPSALSTPDLQASLKYAWPLSDTQDSPNFKEVGSGTNANMQIGAGAASSLISTVLGPDSSQGAPEFSPSSSQAALVQTAAAAVTISANHVTITGKFKFNTLPSISTDFCYSLSFSNNFKFTYDPAVPAFKISLGGTTYTYPTLVPATGHWYTFVVSVDQGTPNTSQINIATDGTPGTTQNPTSLALLSGTGSVLVGLPAASTGVIVAADINIFTTTAAITAQNISDLSLLTVYGQPGYAPLGPAAGGTGTVGPGASGCVPVSNGTVFQPTPLAGIGPPLASLGAANSIYFDVTQPDNPQLWYKT